MKGTVEPSSSRPIAAATCAGLTLSSSAMRSAIDFTVLESFPSMERRF